MSHETLHRLAQRAGLAVTWRDYRGEACEVPPETLRRVLEALDYPCASPEQERDSLARLEAEIASPRQPPLITAVAGEAVQLEHGVPDREYELELESGERQLLRSGIADGRLVLPAILEAGYHRLRDAQQEIVIAVAPPRCHGIGDCAPGRRLWGLSAQIYALRRAGDGGYGDFRALAELARQAAGQGADALALSPVHALFSADAQHYGPYAPSSRLFLNAAYADPDAFPDCAVPPSPQAQPLEDLPLIDWPEAVRARLARLRGLHEALEPRLRPDSGDARAAEFAAFCAAGGAALLDHARFEVLHAEQFAAGRWHWQYWPEALRHPQNPEVAEVAQQHAAEVRFHLFLQWLAQRGLAAAQAAAREGGMAIGLIGDLAVGTDSGGSHAWSRQRELLRGLSVGAPPDELAGLGQNWGLTAFSPRALRDEAFSPFLEVLRANLRDVGGLRIDHVFGLQRLWIVPEGANACDGAYLHYPLQDLLRLIALESARARAVIIGEDLGTVPEGFREAVERVGMLGMRVLWFERDYGYFVEPSRWPRTAMATTTTHDLPTTAGWWDGRDVDWRARLRQFPPEHGEEQAREQRQRDRVALWDAFRYAGLAEGDAPPTDQPQAVVDAALRFVARTPCELAMVPVDDIIGLDEQPNLPGTLDEHPNWRRRLPATTAELFAGEAPQRRFDTLRRERGGT